MTTNKKNSELPFLILTPLTVVSVFGLLQPRLHSGKMPGSDQELGAVLRDAYEDGGPKVLLVVRAD